MPFMGPNLAEQECKSETRERHMAKLPRFSLSHNEKTKKWDLKKEGSGEVVKSFKTKAAATKGGVLERAVGGMGSVRIRKRNGKIQESAPIRAAWIRAGGAEASQVVPRPRA